MTRPKLLIAEKNSELRTRMLQTAVDAGYQVKTTATVAQLLCQVLRKQAPVLLLGDNFEANLALTDLLRLIKTCNSRLAIILVSDEVSLMQVRKARQLGIFYHSLPPDNPADWQELKMAVACAFRTSRMGEGDARAPEEITDYEIARELH